MTRGIVVATALASALPATGGTECNRAESMAAETEAAPFPLARHSAASGVSQRTVPTGQVYRGHGGLVAIAEVAPQPEGHRPGGLVRVLVTAEAEDLAPQKRPAIKVIAASLPDPSDALAAASQEDSPVSRQKDGSAARADRSDCAVITDAVKGERTR